MKSLGQGFGGEAPNVTPNREAIKEKRQSGSEATPDGLKLHRTILCESSRRTTKERAGEQRSPARFYAAGAMEKQACGVMG